MKHSKLIASVLVACLIGLAAGDAAAWGKNAQQAITTIAIQLTRQSFPDAFRTDRITYDSQVIQGSLQGAQWLRDFYPIKNVDEAVSAVATEIQLLRAAREFGIDAYFCFRMGVLAGLVSDLAMPFGIQQDPASLALKRRLDDDIEARFTRFLFEPRRSGREYLRNPNAYFAAQRDFLDQAEELIRNDYRTGAGYDGIMRNGGVKYFINAVESTADMWFTILRTEGDPSEVPPSERALTDYLTNKIGYELNVMKNLSEADRTYNIFRRVNPGILASYEKVGDYYYNFSAQTKDRGVREWQKALEASGEGRSRVVKKLANHYMQVGLDHLGVAEKDARRRDQALTNALEAFRESLRFDRTSDQAADFLTKTNRQIREREEARQVVIDLMASAETIMEKAEEENSAGNYGAAITTFARAQATYDKVDPNFPDYQDTAQKQISEIRKRVNKIISDVIDKANLLINDGDKAVDQKRFDEATDYYKRAESILADIPTEENTTPDRERKESIAKAKEKAERAQIEKKRWEEQQAQLAQQGGAA